MNKDTRPATLAEMNWLAAVDVRDQLAKELAAANREVQKTWTAVQAERQREVTR